MNIALAVLSHFSLLVDDCYTPPIPSLYSALFPSPFYYQTTTFFKATNCQRCEEAEKEAGDGGPPVDMLLLAQPLIDIERAAGEERTGPLLANLCFNQRV